MKSYVFAFLAAVLFSVRVVADTGSVSVARAAMAPPDKITLAWTASTGGVVSVSSDSIRGALSRILFAVGSPAPTNATYAVTLKDATGIDGLAGQGAAVASNAVGTAVQVIPGALVVSTTGITNLHTGFLVNGPLSLSISGVGTSSTAALGKQGSVIIYAE